MRRSLSTYDSPARPLSPRNRSSAPSRSPYTGRITASAIGPPDRVHDRRARVVVLAVLVGVESWRVPLHPLVEDVERTCVDRVRRRAAAQHLAHDRPHERPRVLGRGAVHHAHVVGQRDLGRELVEQLDAVDGPERRVVAVHEARRRLVVPVQQQPTRPADAARVLRAVQEAAPLVVAGARASAAAGRDRAHGAAAGPTRSTRSRCATRTPS